MGLGDIERTASGQCRATLGQLCMTFGGWGNEWWADLVFGSGEVSVDRSPAGYVSVIRLAHFDLDYETAVVAQVCDTRSAPDQRRWQYVMWFNTGRNDWVPEVVCWWATVRPSFAEMGAALDTLLASMRPTASG
jgi:hypothetical protein